MAYKNAYRLETASLSASSDSYYLLLALHHLMLCAHGKKGHSFK